MRTQKFSKKIITKKIITRQAKQGKQANSQWGEVQTPPPVVTSNSPQHPTYQTYQIFNNPLNSNVKNTASDKGGRKVRKFTKKLFPKFSKFQLQSTAQEILKGNRVCLCLKQLTPADKEARRIERATIYEHLKTGKHFYGGLMQCASIWVCPTCGAKVSERRKEELRKIVDEANKKDHTILFATYTFSHHYGDSLSWMLNAFKEARRRVRAGRAYKDFKENYEVIGSVEALELTHNKNNGYHPHAHELLFFSKKLSDIEIQDIEIFLRERWQEQALKEGLEMNEHGFDLKRTKGAIADYIEKYGKQPKNALAVWGSEEEITKAIAKTGRDESLTYLDMLSYIRFLEVQEQTQEVIREIEYYKDLVKEYAKALKGRHQLQYGRKIRKTYSIEEKSDQQLLEEEEEEAIPLVSMNPPAWNIVLGNDMREELLEMHPIEVKNTLIELGANPDHITLHRTEDKETEAKEKAILSLMESFNISRSDAEERLEGFTISRVNIIEASPDKIPDQHEEPEEEYQDLERNREELENTLLKKLAAYNVSFSNPCPKCGCRLKRNVLGELECCNCSPSPLWSNKTVKDIKIISRKEPLETNTQEIH